MNRIKDSLRQLFLSPVVSVLVRWRIHPTTVTLSTLILAAGAGYFYAHGNFWAGAVIFFFCGIFDTFDGEIARRTGRVTKIGGFLDSTIDRINEFIIYLGLFLYYYHRLDWILVWILTALFGSLMVSYTRARAEGLGTTAAVGIFERVTRIVLLIAGSVFGPRVMPYIIIIIAAGTIVTMLQRMFFVFRQNHHRPG